MPVTFRVQMEQRHSDPHLFCIALCEAGSFDIPVLQTRQIGSAIFGVNAQSVQVKITSTESRHPVNPGPPLLGAPSAPTP